MATGDVWDNQYLATAFTETLQRKPELASKVLTSSEVFEDGIQVRTGCTDTDFELGGVDIAGTILQPGNTRDTDGNSFTPKGGVTPELHRGHIEKGKIDILFTERDMERMLPTMIRKYGQAFIESIPEEEFILMMIWEKANDELYTDLMWGGVKASTQDNTAIVDGFKKLITDAIANVATTGEAALKKIAAGQILTASAYTNANSYAQLQAQHKLIPERLRSKPLVTFSSQNIFDLYNEDFLTKFGAMSFDKNLLENGRSYLHYSNNRLIPRIGLSGSERVIMTPFDNLVVAFLDQGDLSNVKFQPYNRDIKIMADFKVGFGIENYDRLYVNSRT